jgi:glycosyltransferase involved in cell wall biosynthesis
MLAQFYPPFIGGTERIVHDLSVELSGRGHDVAVATLHHPGLPEYEMDDGVQVHRLRSTTRRISGLFKDTHRRHAPPAPDPEAMWDLRRILKRHRPDVVHAHNWLLYTYLPLKPFYPARLVVTLHDYGLRCPKMRLMHQGAPCSGPQLVKCLGCASEHFGATIGMPTAAAHWLMRSPAHRAVDMFLPISHAVAEGSGLVGGRWPYQVIPDFVPDVHSEPRADYSTYLRQLPPDGFLMFAGDLSADKGVDVLLDAYTGMVDVPPLVMIGRQSSARRLAAPNVVVLNDWPHEAVIQAWQRCSVALAPSVWAEPFGLVVLEAMAAGRPVIASRTGGICDIIVDQESGWLVPPGDASSLRAAIRKLCDSPEVRERLSQAARQRAASFSAEAVVPRLEQVYRSLTALRHTKAARTGQPGEVTTVSEAAPDV